ncbi:hypothetical protein VNO77_33450 [Canavalia gladiata]|uniref:Uncharacterized protein n=1 Tax=Canavalia gladiata TaxID=3824 RepID=A0AAN9KBU4_CANGL
MITVIPFISILTSVRITICFCLLTCVSVFFPFRFFEFDGAMFSRLREPSAFCDSHHLSSWLRFITDPES